MDDGEHKHGGFPRSDEGGQIPTNLRLLLILEKVAEAGTPMTPTEVNAGIGLPKPTLHRLFSTLETEGFLQRDINGRSYGPGPRLRGLAVHTMSSQRMRVARVAILSALAEELGETCNLAIPDRERMVYLDRVETKWPLRIQLPIGSSVPFHATASGKMYLSTLRPRQREKVLSAQPLTSFTARTLTSADQLQDSMADIQRLGYATDNQEFMDGMCALAVPVFDDHSRMVATLSVHCPNQRKTVLDLIEMAPRLRDAADDLAETMLE